MTPILIQAGDAVSAFVQSSFFSTCAAALAGAGFGAWGAQRLAERTARARELLEGLRQANAVIVLAATISNQALSNKKQWIQPITDKYFQDRKNAEIHNNEVLSGKNPQPRAFQAELRRLTPLTVPIEALENLIFTARLMPGRALALVAMVQQSVTELANTIRVHTEMIEYFHSTPLPHDVFCQDYYGLKRRDGNENAMFYDAMVAVKQYTDDVAFFGAELARELEEHGQRIRAKLVKLRRDVPRVSTADFSGPVRSGLMPPREGYEAWLAGFRAQDVDAGPNNSSKRTRKRLRAA